ncbi:unnamed protein product [Adineta steineri]|uniref:Uncharacterized protein n=1 Tax=Adineta steineri TaxID=433720 RepID=A0A815J2D6_9BILA|nr:unnamed protein product [Adineta steineri]
MNIVKLIYCVLILSTSVKWCSGRIATQDLLNGVFNDEARKIAQKLHKRFFDNLCIHAGSFETEWCGFFNADGTCACNAGIDDFYWTDADVYDQDDSGTVEQKERYE